MILMEIFNSNVVITRADFFIVIKFLSSIIQLFSCIKFEMFLGMSVALLLYLYSTISDFLLSIPSEVKNGRPLERNKMNGFSFRVLFSSCKC